MWLVPTELDIWFSAQLAEFLGQCPLFDLAVQSAIRHNVLGGFWYAAALFVLWLRGSQEGNEATRRRMLTILLGSLIAILLIPVAQALVVWPPPIHCPRLAHLYPRYIEGNPDSSSFPSQSTTLYAALAAGIYSCHRLTGSLLWVGVAVLVGLPRIYVGGHYLSDVLAGIVLGMAGYAGARYFLESRLVPPIERSFRSRTWVRVLGEAVMFAWIYQVAVEFRDVVWLKRALEYLLKGGGPSGLP